MADKASTQPKTIRIKPEPNKFDDHFLDVIGNTFKFDHPKGLAEWLKNSADAYATMGARDRDQFILLRFQVAKPKSRSVFECIDFVGCTKKDIDDALKVWGRPDAAKKGKDIPTYGGHGNGGKFYMRQLFKTSQMITYQRGLLNVFGFDEKHRYGFSTRNTNRRIELDKALKFAGIDGLAIPDAIRHRWKKAPKQAGFSVVRGMGPGRFRGRSTVKTILDRLRLHPQARRLLQHKQVIVLSREQPWGERLEAPTVDPKQGFEKPVVVDLPRQIEWDGNKTATRSSSQKRPRLTLYTSDSPLTRSRELASLNTIDILGEIGCIGSYRMNELGFLSHAAESDFIYGECECAFLEDEKLSCVMNDRERLIRNDLTDALLDWIREQVEALAAAIGEKRRQEKKSRDLAQSSLFNQLLDKWKNRFMSKLTLELFGGTGVGDIFGGPGGGGSGSGTGGGGGGGGGGGEQGKGTGTQGGSGDERRRGSKFPTVLLSGHDQDPFDPEAAGPFECDERHPPVYQRLADIDGGVYWINSSRPLAGKILERNGSEHPRWREYLFQRYVDIILKQQLYELQTREAGFTAERVDWLIDEVTARVHDAAAADLEEFLFNEHLTGQAPPPSQPEKPADGSGAK